MYGHAEDDGRVYQAGGDQHITEYHQYHVHVPDLDDDEDEYYDDAGYHGGSDVWDAVRSVLFSLVPLIVPVLAGASTRDLWIAKPEPSMWWVITYTLAALILSVVAVTSCWTSCGLKSWAPANSPTGCWPSSATSTSCAVTRQDWGSHRSTRSDTTLLPSWGPCRHLRVTPHMGR
jgi:hypothetical protein